MALIENGKGGFLLGLTVGLGVALVTKGVVPALRDVGKPLAKAALKSGWLFFEKTRESLAELTEEVEDLVAEVQAEVVAEVESDVTGAAPEPPAETKPNNKVRARKAASKKKAP
jgi:hypothetical protein